MHADAWQALGIPQARVEGLGGRADKDFGRGGEVALFGLQGHFLRISHVEVVHHLELQASHPQRGDNLRVSKILLSSFILFIYFNWDSANNPSFPSLHTP